MQQIKYLLPESEIPRQWYNLAPDLPSPMLPPLGPDGKPCAVDDIKSRTCVGVVVVRGGLCYGGGNGACNTRGGSLVGKEGSRVRVWEGGWRVPLPPLPGG